MRVKPMLGDWEVPHIESIQTAEHRSFVELPVPGRTGSLFQDMSPDPTRIVIAGSLYGDEARDEFLQQVRGKFQAGEPVTFVADIITATEVQHVVVEDLRFQESGLRPDQMDYYIVLRESPPPPPPPSPVGGLDAGLLDQAAGFMDTVTGALDVIDQIGSVPDIGDPTPPVREAMDLVSDATGGVQSAATLLGALFGDEE